MKGFLFDVRKYRKESVDALAERLRKELPCSITHPHSLAIATTIAVCKSGRLVFHRAAGLDLLVEWSRNGADTSVRWDDVPLAQGYTAEPVAG